MVVIRKTKGTTAKTKRFLAKREPKWIEDPKTALLIRGSTSSNLVNQVLTDLHQLKTPLSIHFTRKNELRPFEDTQPLEFFSQKNNTSLILVGSHSKKRPHNLVFVRTFNHQILDMMEFGIENYTSLKDIAGPKCAVGVRPLLLFHGPWDTQPQLKSLFVDFFHGYTTTHLDLTGVQLAIALTITETKIHFRTYTLNYKKSTSEPNLSTRSIPNIELQSMGPHFDLLIRRSQPSDDKVWKQAHKYPSFLAKLEKGKKIKNVEKDVFGDVFGQLHIQKQNLLGLQTRKMKGLKSAISKIKSSRSSSSTASASASASASSSSNNISDS